MSAGDGSSQTAYHRDALAIGRELAQTEGRLMLPVERQRHWERALLGRADAERRTLAVHLVAMSRQLSSRFGQVADVAVLQLTILVAGLLGNLGRAIEAFERVGLKVSAMARVLGGQAPARDAAAGDSGSGPGGLRLFDMILAAKAGTGDP